ncbi:MAG: hypothetical protein ACJAT4_001035 [Granulosicoccus sp.]|jgi:hypothetical protein
MEKKYFSVLIFLLFFTGLVKAQYLNYNAYISQFASIGNVCNFEIGGMEYTRKGWIEYEGTNVSTYSGCNECDSINSCVQSVVLAEIGYNFQSFAPRVRARIDAWEDDTGDRCEFDPATGIFGIGDDCRTEVTSGWFDFSTPPVEYEFNYQDVVVGDLDHNLTMTYGMKYSEKSLEEAVDNFTYPYSTSGSTNNRGFWGSFGPWATNGSDCATSGTIQDGETSSFSTTVSCVDQVSFKWSVSSEVNFDFLRFYVDGVQQNSISGSVGWTTKTYALDPNFDHDLKWSYTKDNTVSNGIDRGFVDQITYNSAQSVPFPYANGLDAFTVSGNATGFEGCWTANPSATVNAYRWNTSAGVTLSEGTGPAIDQSLGNNSGIYIYSEASGYTEGDIAELISPFIDVASGATNPLVSFYYHMFGFQMGTLHIDLHDGTSWINDFAPAIEGQQQTLMTDAWIEKTFDISAYKGSSIKIRFRAERGNGFRSDMAIDNLQVMESSVLPIELEKFEGVINKKGEHLLSWQSAAEENASHFLLEHSKDGIQFETLGRIAAEGNSTITSSYSVTNFFPSQPDNYYRLKMVDLDESFEYSSIVYLASSGQNSGVTIFPNPSDGRFQFTRPSDKKEWQLMIFNSVGQLVKTIEWQEDDTTYQLNLDDFPNGIYNVQILNKSEIIETKRLVKI